MVKSHVVFKPKIIIIITAITTATGKISLGIESSHSTNQMRVSLGITLQIFKTSPRSVSPQSSLEELLTGTLSFHYVATQNDYLSLISSSMMAPYRTSFGLKTYPTNHMDFLLLVDDNQVLRKSKFNCLFKA